MPPWADALEATPAANEVKEPTPDEQNQVVTNVLPSVKLSSDLAMNCLAEPIASAAVNP